MQIAEFHPRSPSGDSEAGAQQSVLMSSRGDNKYTEIWEPLFCIYHWHQHNRMWEIEEILSFQKRQICSKDIEVSDESKNFQNDAWK